MRARAADGHVPLGSRVLAEFRDERSVDEIRALLSAFGDDAATATLRSYAGDDLDLSLRTHRVALLRWLRAWGCRHLRVADTGRSSRALAGWWRRSSSALPALERPLTHLSAAERSSLGECYAALASLRAATRASGGGGVAVTFGDTAAAKALFAVRPRACPPWDEPIRLAFGRERADAELYARYLAETADALRGGARRLGVGVGRVPGLLGRPGLTPARVIDEYLWIRITRDRGA